MLPRISGAKIGILVIETITKIRRAHFVRGKLIKQICCELKLPRKVVRSEETAFEYKRTVHPLPKLGPWREELGRLLVANAAQGSRERVTVLRIFEDLRALGFDDFDDFDAVEINETLACDLAAGGLLEQQRNVVLIGGTGKSRAAIARACIRHRARFFNGIDLGVPPVKIRVSQ